MTITRFSSRIIVAIGALMLLSACSPLGKEDVIGYYEANPKDAVETLDIKSNGTFIHIYKSRSGIEFKNEGSWRFVRQERDIRIVFSVFTFGPFHESPREKDKKVRRVADWPALVESFLGRVSIPIYIEGSYRFRKIN